MSKIFITGDIHGGKDIRKLSIKNFPEQNYLTKHDYVIICGDLDLLSNDSLEKQYWRKWLNNKNFTTLFVDGNHENFDKLNSLPIEQWNGGKTSLITESIRHLKRGQVFTINGYTFFTMGGAASINIDDEPPLLSYAQEGFLRNRLS